MNRILKQYEFMLNCYKYDDKTCNNLQSYQSVNNELKKTTKATQSRQNNILKQWQEAFRYMVEIRDLCIKEGPKKGTERELWKMFETKGYKINSTQMKYFKTLLPDGYVDREGGAPKQG